MKSTDKINHAVAVLTKAVVVLGVITIVVGTIVSVKDRAICSAATLSDASQYFNAQDVANLKPIIANIKHMSGYNHDPNCLYAVIVYDINTSNYSDALQADTTLQKVYNPKLGFSSKLGSGQYSIQMLKQNVAELKLQDASYAQGVFGVTNP